MAPNIVEKRAQALNQLLRTEGKKYGKVWRSRIRELLSQTFAALNAKPLDGALCLRLSEQIEAELKAIEEGTVDVERGAEKPKKVLKPVGSVSLTEEEGTTTLGAVKAAGELGEKLCCGNLGNLGEKGSCDGDIEGARMAEGHSAQGEPCMAEGHSGVGAEAPEKEATVVSASKEEGALCHVPAEEVGLFDLIHVRIRCFFKINACVRPPYIGRFVRFADKFSEVVQTRIDRFIGVLDKGDEDFVAKTEVEVGYRDDLIPDMPDMGLVLHPKKKKKR